MLVQEYSGPEKGNGSLIVSILCILTKNMLHKFFKKRLLLKVFSIKTKSKEECYNNKGYTEILYDLKLPVCLLSILLTGTWRDGRMDVTSQVSHSVVSDSLRPHGL